MRDGRALGPAGVLLLVMSIALVYLGGLVLLGSAMAPPLGPEDDVTTVSWAAPLVAGLAGVPVALLAAAGPALLLLVRHLASGRTTADDLLLVVALGAGTLAILVASMDRWARRGAGRPDVSGGPSS